MSGRAALLQGVLAALILGAAFLGLFQRTSAVQAAPAQQQTGLRVDGALLQLEVTPGGSYEHKMRISSANDLPTLNITVSAAGFGQAPDGSYLALDADQDTSPSSARTFIREISKTAFALKPGEGQDLSATIETPQDLGTAPRYAIIHIEGAPAGPQENVGFKLAAYVLIVLTPKGAQITDTGEISDLAVVDVVAGQPIVVATTVKNTGNHHFKVQNDVSIWDSTGAEVAKASAPQSATSVLPGYALRLETSPVLAMDSSLEIGRYLARSRVSLLDGTLLDEAEVWFDVKERQEPLPGIVEGSLVLVEYRDEEPAEIDAKQKAGLELGFRDTGKVTGWAAVGRYAQEPPLPVQLAAGSDGSGTGATGMRYVGARVDGFVKGTAHVTLYYRDNEVAGVEENSLYLAYFDGKRWRKLDYQTVYTGLNSIAGDLPVAVLSRGATVIALAADGAAAKQAGNWFTQLAQEELPLLVGGIGAILVLVVVGAVLLARRRSKTS